MEDFAQILVKYPEALKRHWSKLQQDFRIEAD